MFHFLFDIFNLHGLYCTIVFIQVLYEVGYCAVGIVDVGLMFMLDLFLFDQIEDLLLQHVFGFDNLVPLFKLGHMVLDPPLDFG